MLAGASALALPAGLALRRWPRRRSCATASRWPTFRSPRGQPDRGAGAYQFTGLTIYDPLVAWELDVADRPGKLIPGLATEWKVNEADKTLWTFKLRARREIP